MLLNRKFSAEILKKLYDTMCSKEKDKCLSQILKGKSECQKENDLFEVDCDESGKYKICHNQNEKVFVSCQKEDERYYSYSVDCEVDPFCKISWLS